MLNTAEVVHDLERKVLFRACVVAALVTVSSILFAELLFSDFFHWHQSSLHNLETPILEAELIEQRPPAQLYQRSTAPEKSKETTVSKRISNESDSHAKKEDEFPDKNITSTEAPPSETHGPVVDYSPAPKLPEYLKNQNLKSTILIEFQISQNGAVVPRLLSSSGNEELDALALKTASTWRFRPAMKEGHAIDARVRLRINFEVD